MNGFTRTLPAAWIVLLAVACEIVSSGGEAGDGPGEEARVVELAVGADAVVARVERGDAAVTIDLQRGAARPSEILAGSPTLGTHEIDVRVRDRSGHAFLFEFGGHGPADRTWAASVRPPEPGLDLRSLDADLTLAGEAASLLGQEPRIPEAFSPGVRALANLVADVRRDQPAAMATGETVEGGAAAPGLATYGEATGDPDPVPGVETVQAALVSAIVCPASSYKHRITIRSGVNSVLHYDYDHSATQLRVYRCTFCQCETTAVLVVGSSNHGASVAARDDDGNLVLQNEASCPREFAYRDTYAPLLQPYLDEDDDAVGASGSGNGESEIIDGGGCATNYGTGDGSHVCNDDSLVQFWMVKYELTERYDFWTCHNNDFRRWAPDCSDDYESPAFE